MATRQYNLFAKRIDINKESLYEDIRDKNYVIGDWYIVDRMNFASKEDADHYVDSISADFAKNKTNNTEFKCEVFLDKDWRAREEKRIKEVYKKLPKEWNKLKPIDGHFCHISSEDGLIAYTDDEDKGQRDIQTRSKPGKYIKKFYPDLSNEEVRYYASAVQALEGVKFTSDDKDAASIYANGPTSCMKYKESDKVWAWQINRATPNEKMPIHPVAMYFAGDLELAYLGDINAPEARTIVWPEKKVYTTVYGSVTKMGLALQNLGYTAGSLNGARLRYTRYSDDHIVMPFLDNCNGISYCEGQLYFGDVRQLKEFSGKKVSVFQKSQSRGIVAFSDPTIMRCVLTREKISENSETVEIEGYAGVALKSAAISSKFTETVEGQWTNAPVYIEVNNKKTIHISTFQIPNAYLRCNDGIYRPSDDCMLVAVFGGKSAYAKKRDDVISYNGKNFEDINSLFKHYPNLNPCPNYNSIPMDIFDLAQEYKIKKKYSGPADYVANVFMDATKEIKIHEDKIKILRTNYL